MGLLCKVYKRDFISQRAAELERVVSGTLAGSPADSVAGAYAVGEVPIPSQPEDRTPIGYYNLGVGYMNRGEHLEAALLYRRVLQLDTASADAYHNLGWSLASLGLFETSIPAFERVLRYRPGDELATNLTWVRSQMGSRP